MDVKAIDSIALARSAAATPRSVSSAGAGTTAVASGAAASTGDSSGAAGASSGFIYISPVVRYDQAARLAVLFYRDPDTGATRDQIPAEQVVEEYRRANLSRDSASGQGATANRRSGETPATGQTDGTATDGRTAGGFSATGNRGSGTSAAALYQAAATLGGQGGGTGSVPAVGTAVPAAGVSGSAGASSGGRVSVTV